MANDEHVARLRKGVAAWNEWREQNPYIHPDFIDADRRGANLFEANLGWANFFSANLIDANLSKANLVGAILGVANLVGGEAP